MGISKQPNLTGLCLICGNPTKIKCKGRKEYNDCCSVSCGSTLGQRRMMARTGGVHPASAKEVTEKRRQTCIEKYGVPITLNKPDAVNRRNKRMNDPDVKDKIRATLLKNFGVTSPRKNKSINDKAKNTMLREYGVSNSMHVQTLRDKNKQINAENYLADSWTKKLDRCSETLGISPLFAVHEYVGTGIEYMWRHECGAEFAQVLHKNGQLPRCPKCHPAKYSLPQSLIHNFIADLGIAARYNNRAIITPLEIDVWIPELNLGIEVNGIYWHQATNGRTSLKVKSDLAEAEGVQILHFWDYEILNRFDMVAQIIVARLGLNQTTHGIAEYEIGTVTKQEADAFLAANHLEGPDCTTELHMALWRDGVLAAVAAFHGGELRRLCAVPSAPYQDVVDKIIAHAQQIFGDQSITVIVNKRISFGQEYVRLGQRIEDSPPKTYYVSGVANTQLIECLDGTKAPNGWFTVEDCGAIRYVIQPEHDVSKFPNSLK